MKILKTKLPQDKSVKLYVNIVFSVDIAKQNTPFVAFARFNNKSAILTRISIIQAMVKLY
jgi:hypothetical protein